MSKLPLYLGLDPGNLPCVHYPVIYTQMLHLEDQKLLQAFGQLESYSHLIFTSQQAVRFFFACVENKKPPLGKVWVSIGEATSKQLECHGVIPNVAPLYTATESTQEGVMVLLEQMAIPQEAYFFYPRSNLARPFLAKYLQQKGWQVEILDLYETKFQKLEPVPDLAEFEEIIFTSPSTVEGFLRIYGKIPSGKRLKAIGPITAAALAASR